MTILARYITQEIAKYFGIILTVVVGIYLTVDFIEKVDNFIDAGVPLIMAGVHLAFRLPLILVQITPVASLLAVMITFGLMAKNNELLALRSSGISLASLVGPIVRFGIAALLFSILMAEIVAPMTVNRANQIWYQDVKKRNSTSARQNDIWIKSENSILNLKFFEPQTQEVKGMTVHRFDDDFNLVERIDARTGTFQNDSWLLRDGIRQQRRDGTDAFAVQVFDELDVQLGYAPEDLAQAAPKPEEMSFMQLHRYVTKVEAEGYDATHYRVDLHAKIAFPLVSLIMTFIGAGLAARGKIKEGLAGSVTYGLGIVFLYWISFSFCLSLGYAGMLPPIIAAWCVNVFSMSLAGYLLINAD
ncbi:MAG: hypothetical protein VR64_08315 [Desulfatitalea sp. BRH_c12]|nr:MAG: hypothetical protein VR64_08315 [Desulfatitalea sp. BRH_c12]